MAREEPVRAGAGQVPWHRKQKLNSNSMKWRNKNLKVEEAAGVIFLYSALAHQIVFIHTYKISHQFLRDQNSRDRYLKPLQSWVTCVLLTG